MTFRSPSLVPLAWVESAPDKRQLFTLGDCWGGSVATASTDLSNSDLLGRWGIEQ